MSSQAAHTVCTVTLVSPTESFSQCLFLYLYLYLYLICGLLHFVPRLFICVFWGLLCSGLPSASYAVPHIFISFRNIYLQWQRLAPVSLVSSHNACACPLSQHGIHFRQSLRRAPTSRYFKALPLPSKLPRHIETYLII